jgi:hypothetical protein
VADVADANRQESGRAQAVSTAFKPSKRGGSPQPMRTATWPPRARGDVGRHHLRQLPKRAASRCSPHDQAAATAPPCGSASAANTAGRGFVDHGQRQTAAHLFRGRAGRQQSAPAGDAQAPLRQLPPGASRTSTADRRSQAIRRPTANSTRSQPARIVDARGAFLRTDVIALIPQAWRSARSDNRCGTSRRCRSPACCRRRLQARRWDGNRIAGNESLRSGKRKSPGQFRRMWILCMLNRAENKFAAHLPEHRCAIIRSLDRRQVSHQGQHVASFVCVR